MCQYGAIPYEEGARRTMNKYSELESIKVVGIDLAKRVFHLHGVNEQGEMVMHWLRSMRIKGTLPNGTNLG